MPENRYAGIIAAIFRSHYSTGDHEFLFDREEFVKAARALRIKLPKNLGDIIYSFRYRADLPKSISQTAPKGMEWAIRAAGRGRYKFCLTKLNRIKPREGMIPIKIPDSTPEIVNAYALSDEQALLAKVRYNRLVDIFLGITAYSLQNHLRTTLKNVGQLEIDELYVGVNKTGQQFVVPVQAKSGADQLGPSQTEQDIACCSQKFSKLTCRAVSAQFMKDSTIAMFELALADGEVGIVEERHYQLVPSGEISEGELKNYASR